MKVKVDYEEGTKTYEGATKITSQMAFSSFENEIEIYQGKKKTVIKEFRVIGFEITE